MPSAGTLQTTSAPLIICAAPLVSDHPHVEAPPSRPPHITHQADHPSTCTTPSAAPTRCINTHAMTTRSKNNIQELKKAPDGSIVHPLSKALLAAVTPDATEPSCYTEAAKHSHWRATTSLEFDALLKNQTWELVLPDSHTNVVGCRWIFKIKRRNDGTVKRYKARLMAKGYHQLHGIDFHETYSPVIKPATVRLVLSLAVSSGSCLRQIDIQNAFLHGSLQEVFMVQPLGFQHPQYPHYVSA
ncbi:uncharacterized mitochondrial protein AtMg00820-like [Carya illinoinensis]|uniref:uncharacterized mitochondrial protein AtMg00820-like n=1 Tax=Carya illinoinensis TaxID=32201 RepID=UPI001C71F51C|nr:uncharacterized mitochondrial protein AtMg00820-like [Carya illinoinensis]